MLTDFALVVPGKMRQYKLNRHNGTSPYRHVELLREELIGLLSLINGLKPHTTELFKCE